MVSQTSIAICALCKNPLPTPAHRQPTPTRLCSTCCSLIETIFPQAGARSVTAARSERATLATPESATAQRFADSQSAILASEHFVATAEPPALADKAANGAAGNNGAYHSLFVQAEQDFAPVYEAESNEFYFQELPVDTPSTHEVETAPQPGQTEEVANLLTYEPPEAQALASNDQSWLNDQAFSGAPSESFAPEESSLLNNGVYAPTLAEEKIIDSGTLVSGFPYLVEDNKSKPSNSKALLGLAGIALLGCLVAGYLFIYKPFFGTNENPPAAKIEANKPDDKSAAKPAATDTEQAAAGDSAKAKDAKNAPTEVKKPEEAKSDNLAAVDASHTEGGQFALQAGIFSTEANANNLADQLKRAGIPAYVAPSKGNKFRVLVGRFASSGEAQKYIAQAQTRANTAGIKLELFASEINP